MNEERMKVFVESERRAREEKCLKGHFVHGAGASTSCTGCGKDIEEILEDEA